MRHVVRGARPGVGDGGLLRGHHDLVERALRAGEAPVDGEGAGDVGSVAVEFAAGVDQAQVAVAQFGVAGAVVQHAGIRTGGDDGVVGHALRAVAAEFVEQFGLEVIFAQAGARGPHGAHMRPGGDARGAAHDVELARVLEQAHLIEDGAHVQRLVRRRHARAALRAHGVEPAAHAAVEGAALGQRIGHGGRIGEQARQRRVDLLDRMGFVQAEGFAGGFGTEAETVPDFAFLVLGAAEQHAERRCVAGRHHDGQHGFGLGEAGQVIEVAVVPVGVVAVAVAHGLRRGRDDGDAAARRAQPLRDALAALAGSLEEGEFGGGHGADPRMTGMRRL